MPRGRPPGTLKRAEAMAAAQAVWRGEFEGIREAAVKFRPARIGSDEGFRDFVANVEEAYRDLIRTQPGGLRKWRALAQRTTHRRVQPKSPTNALRRLRIALGLETDDAI